MLPLFRKIRKQLADDNKPLKYIRYAIGEIVLVVIGILIALQINTWNQDRMDRRSEKKALTDLREELMTNKGKIIESIERREAIYRPLERYMELMAEAKVGFNDFIAIHKKNFFSGRIIPSFGVINSLISSGDVNLITNDSLKYLVTDWKDTAAYYEAVENASFQGHRRFSEYFYNRFPDMGNQFHHKSSEDLRDRFEKITKDVEYGNRMITIQEHFKSGIENGQKLRAYIDGIIHLIDREIQKLD